jgi:hypothetical protein
VITTSSKGHWLSVNRHLARFAVSLATTVFVSLPWQVQKFIYVKCYIPTEIPSREITFTDTIALRDQIGNQPPNASHHQPTRITGVPNSTTARENITSQTRKCKSEDPNFEEAISQWFCALTGRGVRVNGPLFKSKSKELSEKLGHNDFKVIGAWFPRWKCKYETELKNVLVNG